MSRPLASNVDKTAGVSSRQSTRPYFYLGLQGVKPDMALFSSCRPERATETRELKAVSLLGPCWYLGNVKEEP